MRSVHIEERVGSLLLIIHFFNGRGVDISLAVDHSNKNHYIKGFRNFVFEGIIRQQLKIIFLFVFKILFKIAEIITQFINE